MAEWARRRRARATGDLSAESQRVGPRKQQKLSRLAVAAVVSGRLVSASWIGAAVAVGVVVVAALAAAAAEPDAAEGAVIVVSAVEGGLVHSRSPTMMESRWESDQDYSARGSGWWTEVWTEVVAAAHSQGAPEAPDAMWAGILQVPRGDAVDDTAGAVVERTDGHPVVV